MWPVWYAKESARSRGPRCERSIHRAFRKIEKELVGVLRESGQAERGGRGRDLSDVTWRSGRTLSREGSWVDLNLEGHFYYHIGVGLAGY